MPEASSDKAVVFDLGRVLVDFDYSKAAAELARRSDLSLEAIFKRISDLSLLGELETGRMNSDQFFQTLAKEIRFRGTQEELLRLFCEIFDPIPEMEQLVRELRARNVPLFLMSNTNAPQFEYIRSRFPIVNEFWGHVLSYRVGAMKPDPRIYEIAEQLTGRAGEQIVFFDDRPENVQAAAKRNWNAFLHQSVETARAALEKLGLLEPNKQEEPRRS